MANLHATCSRMALLLFAASVLAASATAEGVNITKHSRNKDGFNVSLTADPGVQSPLMTPSNGELRFTFQTNTGGMWHDVDPPPQVTFNADGNGAGTSWNFTIFFSQTFSGRICIQQIDGFGNVGGPAYVQSIFQHKAGSLEKNQDSTLPPSDVNEVLLNGSSPTTFYLRARDLSDDTIDTSPHTYHLQVVGPGAPRITINGTNAVDVTLVKGEAAITIQAEAGALDAVLEGFDSVFPPDSSQALGSIRLPIRVLSATPPLKQG